MDKHEVTAREYFIKDLDEEKFFEIFMLTCREQGVSWCSASDAGKARIEQLARAAFVKYKEDEVKK